MKEHKNRKSPFWVGLFTACVLLSVLLSSGSATGEEQGGQAPKKSLDRPKVVYVADFSLHVEGGGNEGRGPLQVRKRVHDKLDLRMQESPQDKASKVVDVLAQSIVQGLNVRSVKAVRYPGRTRLPAQSWLLEGEFVEYDEGDRLKRTIIGFGSGAADMEVLMKVSEVTDGGLKLLFDSAMDGKKNRMPGAAVTMNPYVAGAKFVMTKTAPDREVKKLGTRIAATLADAIEGSTAKTRP